MSLSGNISEIPLSDLIQVNAHNRRTCVIALKGAGAAGALYFREGALVHARYGNLVGDQAVHALLSARDLAFQVQKPSGNPTATVTKGWQTLILEAAQFQDEGIVPQMEPPRDRAPRDRARVVVPRAPREKRGKGLPWVAASAVLAAGCIAWYAFRVPSAPDRTQSFPPRESPPVAAALPAAPAYEASDLDGEHDAPPKLLSGKPPVMPNLGLSVSPTIVCRLLIDPLGRVTKSHIYRSRLELAAFEELALETVTRYRFSPGRHEGQSVATWINWPVGFVQPSPSTRTEIHIKGSDTIGGKLGPELAESFMNAAPEVQVAVEALGSSTAFVGLFDGTADIGASSRSVKDSELSQAAKLGIRFNEYVIGYDGIAVIVHPANPLTAITIDQASAVFSGEIASWRDLGGGDAPIRLISRPAYSGTHAFFKSRILRRGDKDGPEEFAANTEFVESSQRITELVSADPHAIAYVGLGFASGEIAVLGISPGAGKAPVSPDLESIRKGTYPIYRPLMMYTRGMPSGVVNRFLRFVLAKPGQDLVRENGFVPSDTAAALIESLVDEAGEESPDPPEVKRIHFPGGAELDRAAIAELTDIARQIERERLRVILVGHADAEGQADANKALAEHRALNVAAFFREAGIDSSRIEIASSGEDAPVASNQTATGRAENRRVDLYLIGM